jgi:hypothetical protein
MTHDIPQTAIADMIDQWENLARDARARSRTERTGDAYTAYYYKGVADTCQHVLDQLRMLLDTGEVVVPVPTADYMPVSEQSVNELLSSIGLYPRTLHVHADHVFTAVFSRLQPISQDQRIQALNQADSRIVVLDYGKLPDTNDPYIDFAFRETDVE